MLKEILYGWWFPWTPNYGRAGTVSIGLGYIRLWLWVDAPRWYRYTIITGFGIEWDPTNGVEIYYTYKHHREFILEEYSLLDAARGRICREIE